MDKQKPAIGVSEMEPIGDTRWYKVECDCSSEHHQVTIEVELDDEVDIISVFFYANMHTPFVGFWKRLKIAWHVLVKGEYELNHDLILRPQAALNMANALERGVHEILNRQKVKKNVQ